MYDIPNLIAIWEDLIMRSVGENNDATTRYILADRLSAHIETLDYLEDYCVVCDERNNTAQMIDMNSLVVDVGLAFLCAGPIEIKFTVAYGKDDGDDDEPVRADYLAITREIVNNGS